MDGATSTTQDLMFQRFPLAKDHSSFVTIEIDNDSNINLVIHSLITRYDGLNEVTGRSDQPRTEWRRFSYDYREFLDKVLPYLIQAGKMMKESTIQETHILLHQRFSGGLVVQLLLTPVGNIQLDIR